MTVFLKWKCHTLVLALLSGAHLFAQEPANKFVIQLAGGALKGSEEFQFEKTGTGIRLTGKTRLNQMGRESEFSQEQQLGSDWGFQRYMLAVSMMGQTQMVEATREGEQAVMKAGMGDEMKSQSIALRPDTLVLDNLLVSHYQVLLNMLGPRAAAGGEIFALVPQRLAGIRGTLSPPQRETGTLNGRKIQLQKYTLTLANVLVEIWADADANRLLRVSVPMQKLEIIREGFTVDAAVPPNEPASRNWTERILTFPSSGLQVPAALCLPATAAGRVPTVVMVHGSGPQDRDETIGPNKPFRDIAHGLAEAGIATLRYDKRTFAFKQQIDVRTLTLDQEVTDDAVAALEYIRSLPEVNPGRVFLLGHSMGGMMAPYIARRNPSLRGIILMAAAARPLDQLIVEQVAFQMKVAGSPEADIAKKMEDLKGIFGRIRSGEAMDHDVVLSAPASYWRQVFRLDLPAALAEGKVPVLALQGGKDVQVTKNDFDLIQKALSALPEESRQSIWLPNLNHLFMEVSGQPTGAEYGRAGTVAREVIDSIAAWIRSRNP